VVVIGIRDYQNAFTNPVPVALNDADRFAGFSKIRALDQAPLLLKSADPHTSRLDDATLTKVETELSGAFSQSEVGDTIYLFISARSIARGNLDGYIGTASMSSEKPESGGLPLRFLRKLIEGSRVSRVIIFADASRKPKENIANNIGQRFSELGANPKVAGILATQPGQVSEEFTDSNNPPGYGLFGFYLVNAGTSGPRDLSGVYAVLQQNLKGRQKPADFGSAKNKTSPLWSESAGSPAERTKIFPRSPFFLASNVWFANLLMMQAIDLTSRARAIRMTLLADHEIADPRNLAAEIIRLQNGIPDDLWGQLRNLAVERFAGDAQRAVDDYGIQDLLPDDPLRVTPIKFRAAADGFTAALDLLPTSDSRDVAKQRIYAAFGEELQVRKLLCDALSGPTVDATPLQQAHRLGAVIPEVHNALGIYYLESVKDYDAAIAEFRDAKRASPGWMYPRHNLALALIEKGDYSAAEREYREAIATQPSQPYLYYNLGLLFHRTNSRSEAKNMYEKALNTYKTAIGTLGEHAAEWKDLSPRDESLAAHRARIFRVNQAEVRNAWGILLASGGDLKGAREMYDNALKSNVDLCAARDNWAQLEQWAVTRNKRSAVPGRALSLLTENLARPACADFHPSLLQRARLERKAGDLLGARKDFARVHQIVSVNTEALMGMAEIDSATRDFQSASALLRETIDIETKSGGLAFTDVYVQLAEVQRQTGDAAACRKSFDLALRSAANSSVSKGELRRRMANCDSPERPRF
jgi:tetratricopeptide (TPR) repeat protein